MQAYNQSNKKNYKKIVLNWYEKNVMMQKIFMKMQKVQKA